MIYASISGKRERDVYIESFAVSSGAKIVQTRNIFHFQSSSHNTVIRKKILHGGKAIAFAGLLRGNAHLLDLCVKDNIDFYYIDHAYFNPGYMRPHWMRVTKNGFVQNTILKDIKEDRFKNNFKIEFEKYKFKDHRNIVVLPPSNTVERVFNVSSWENDIIDKIKKYTDRPIVVRRKDGPVMDNIMFNVAKREIYRYEEPIEETISKAYCVVAFNSSAALTALQKGIPVICERYCPAFPLSHNIEDIENLEEKERLPLFSSLAWGQFTIKEIRDPKIFEFINGLRQWKGIIK